MSVSTTIDKLVEMRMTTMSEMFRNQQNDPKMKDIPFEERFAMLVDAEHASRKSHAFERLVKKAELEQNDAGVATIDYLSKGINVKSVHTGKCALAAIDIILLFESLVSLQ